MMTRRHRLLTTGVAALASVTAAAALVASPAGATSSGGRQPSAVAGVRGATHYAVERPVCARPANPALVRCMAVRRVNVAKGTPGAVRYVSPAGLTHGPSGGYTPADLASAYHFNPTTPRSNQTVAIVDWHDNPYALRDLNAFDRHYHLQQETSASFRKVNQNGNAKPLPVTDREAATEISLDVQAVRSVCNTCHILLVEASSGTLGALAAAENTAVRLGATEISNSYGVAEPSHVPASVQAAYRHSGVVITASTGDDGWYGWDWLNEGDTSDNAASFPSTSPYVVAVGGTTLQLGAGGLRSNEYVWNSDGADDSIGAQRGPSGASGGGCSKLFPSPGWQRTYRGYAAAGCHGMRLATDIAAIADPLYGFDIYDSYGASGWMTVGGTSLSSPIVAAMYALVGGAHGSAYPAASLYTNGTYRASSLFDVTLGGSGFCAGDQTTACQNAALQLGGTTNPNRLGAGLADCSYPRSGSSTALPPLSSECNAVSGYDGASGLGAPNTPSAFYTTTAALALRHSATLYARRSAWLHVLITQRVPATYTQSVVWSFGDGSTYNGTARVVHHAYGRAGRYTLSVRVYDSRYQVAVTSVNLTVR